MSYETFLLMLLICSVLTTLIVEALKKMIDYPKANIIAACVSIILGIVVPISFEIWNNVAFESTPKAIVFIAALAVMSWLSAMLGYDKIMQAITQVKGK